MKLFDFIDDDTSRRMLAEFGRTPVTILEDIDAIKEWFKKQPHLPEVPSKLNNILFESTFNNNTF